MKTCSLCDGGGRKGVRTSCLPSPFDHSLTNIDTTGRGAVSTGYLISYDLHDRILGKVAIYFTVVVNRRRFAK